MSILKRNLLIITVITAAIMELIDTSIVNVALNYMSGNLGSTLEDTSWVITAYAIANVIIIPITSFLTSKLGRRNYYIGSILLFTLCSFMCGQATNIWVLVFFRFIQGIGGGALLSVSQVVVFELFSKIKTRACSGAFWGRCFHWAYYWPYFRRLFNRKLLMAVDILYQHSFGRGYGNIVLLPFNRTSH
jgi:DHA2 family multidrug resistance protein